MAEKPVCYSHWRFKNKHEFIARPEARRITIKGFEDILLFVYKNPVTEEWTILEGLTGLSVASDCSRAEAVREARERMVKHDMGRVILEGIEKLGLTPWFTEYFKGEE
jgi:hypothetical protein